MIRFFPRIQWEREREILEVIKGKSSLRRRAVEREGRTNRRESRERVKDISGWGRDRTLSAFFLKKNSLSEYMPNKSSEQLFSRI